MNKLSASGLIFALFLLGISSCIQPPDYPDEPVISNARVNKTSVFQGVLQLPPDTLLVIFDFTDGDGDLSYQEDILDSVDVFLFDSRFPQLDPTIFRLPAIDEQGVGNGISGRITVKQSTQPFNVCCVINSFACTTDLPANTIDTFSYEIQIKDRANNFSNRIRTETLTIVCN